MRYLTWVRAKLDVTAINGSTASHNGHLEDVNDDGIADLVAHLNHSGFGILRLAGTWLPHESGAIE